MKLSTVAAAAFDRMWIAYVYIVITILTCAQATFNSSIGVGAGALAASAFCYFGAATLAGSWRARHDKKYGSGELAGIGVIALALCCAGFALMKWSGFWMNLFGASIKGPVWCAIGIVIALITTKRELAR